MSRIGKRPVNLPAGVEVTVDENNLVKVKGPLGTLQEQISEKIHVNKEDGVVTVSRDSDHRDHRAQHGLARTLINNMVVGVTEGFEKKLQLIGVGYKAEKQGNKLVMNLGFSHPVIMEDPDGITTTCVTATEVSIKGIDKALVGNYAANIRAWRKPEPYKGKGIKYVGEVILRKEGKTGKK